MRIQSINLAVNQLSCPLPEKRRQVTNYLEEENYEFATTDGGIVDSFASATAVALGLGIVVGGFYIGVEITADPTTAAF